MKRRDFLLILVVIMLLCLLSMACYLGVGNTTHSKSTVPTRIGGYHDRYQGWMIPTR